MHVPIGNMKFSEVEIKENFHAVMTHLLNVKPTEVKGSYVRTVFLSSTQGKGVLFFSYIYVYIYATLYLSINIYAGYKLATKYADPSNAYFMREDV